MGGSGSGHDNCYCSTIIVAKFLQPATLGRVRKLGSPSGVLRQNQSTAGDLIRAIGPPQPEDGNGRKREKIRRKRRTIKKKFNSVSLITSTDVVFNYSF